MAEISKVKTTKTNKTKTSNSIRKFLFDRSVPLLFIIICLAGVYFSELPLLFIVSTLLKRITRNSFLVLSLVIPVIAGLGLNFGIVIGAMAGQFAIIAVTHFKVSGFPGFMLCILLTIPIAIVCGILTSMLLNKTKGQEMISSMIAGFFANGVYQFILLFLVGTLIPLKNKDLVLSRGVGIRNTIDLSTTTGLKYSLDNVLKYPLFHVLAVVSVVAIIVICIDYYIKRKNGADSYSNFKYLGRLITAGFILAVSMMAIITNSPLIIIKLPIITSLVIAALWLFNVLIMKTKLGQDFRSVGQDMDIAKVTGINVDRVRTIAVTISILLAAWGQVIFLQDIGTLSTYGSHVQIATFSIAAILLGGASVTKATSGQAIMGVILFHTLFIVSPKAGNNLFGDAQIGEFFRAFVSYGVIGVSLGLHAWNKRVQASRRRIDA
ncbi:MAG: ABC transporter permease [Candidatus Atribacteria bacterium]|nr:ABC transporter permease [Candidatus Atribacteria bacterium]